MFNGAIVFSFSVVMFILGDAIGVVGLIETYHKILNIF